MKIDVRIKDKSLPLSGLAAGDVFSLVVSNRRYYYILIHPAFGLEAGYIYYVEMNTGSLCRADGSLRVFYEPGFKGVTGNDSD